MTSINFKRAKFKTIKAFYSYSFSNSIKKLGSKIKQIFSLMWYMVDLFSQFHTLILVDK